MTVGAWAAVGQQNKVPLRVDEINAVTCGGLANFSNTMGPSLWALNVLPLYAQTGVTGVNFESRPNTAQNLIQPTATASGWQVTVQPEYYGMLAFARLTPPGSRILSVWGPPSGLLAWAVQTPEHTINIVVTNVTSSASARRRSGRRRKGASHRRSAEECRRWPGRHHRRNARRADDLPADGPADRYAGQHPPSAGHNGAYEITVAPASATILSVNG